MRFVQFFASTLGQSKTAVVIRETPTHADLQVFSNDQNGSELVCGVRKIHDFDVVENFPCFAEVTQTINGEVSALEHRVKYLENYANPSLSDEVQQLREIIVRLEKAIATPVDLVTGETDEPNAVSEELGRETERGE